MVFHRLGCRRIAGELCCHLDERTPPYLHGLRHLDVTKHQYLHALRRPDVMGPQKHQYLQGIRHPGLINHETSIFTCFLSPRWAYSPIFTWFAPPRCHETSIFTCFAPPRRHGTSKTSIFSKDSPSFAPRAPRDSGRWSPYWETVTMGALS